MNLHKRRLAASCWLIVVCLWLMSSSSTIAQDGGVDAGRVDALFADWNKPGTPGCALGVIKDGKLIYSRGYGLANLEHNIPLTSATVFDIGSTSKQFTAASIVLLSQQGTLSLEDDVRKFIPELPDYGRKITIRHLLNHTSGIRDYLGLMSLSGVNFDDTTGDDEALKLIIRQKALNFEPGSEYLYSNSGYFLLSVIVRRASGKTLRQFAEEKIFAPLGMKNTHFHDSHTMIVRNRATGYATDAPGAFRIDMSNFEQTGDGAVYTSVEDLVLWDRNFYDPKVGGRAMYDQLLTQGVLNNGKKLSYALGLMIDDYKGLKLIHHAGGWAGYRADFIRFPEQRLSVICLSNLAEFNPSRIARQVADLFLADQLKPSSGPAVSPEEAATVKLNDQELKAVAGVYRDARSRAVVKVYALSDRLMVDYGGGGRLRFYAVPLSKTSFRGTGPAVDTNLDFDIRESNASVSLRMSSQDPVTLERVTLENPTPAQLMEYAGEYYSDELDVTYKLAVNGHRLEYSIGSKNTRSGLEPGVKGVFSSLGMEISFSRDPQGRVNGFDLYAGRVKGLRFIKK